MTTSVPVTGQRTGSVPAASSFNPLRAVAQYLRPDSTGIMNMPRPALRSAQENVRSAYLRAASYAVDAVHNSGWIAGGIEQAITDTNGTGLTLSAKPDASALGWSEDFAEEWSIRTEDLYEAWADDPYECDSAGQMTIAQMADCSLADHYAYGETFAYNDLIVRPNSDSFLKVKMLSPMLCVQDTNESIGLHQGVFTDASGMPIGYRFRRRVQGQDRGTVDIAARDADGKPNIIHVFAGMPGQLRGITPLAPILKITKQYDQLADATLTAALIQTIFAASLKSTGLTPEAFQGLLTESDQKKGTGQLPGPPTGADMSSFINKQVEWYSQFKLDLGSHGRLTHLFPNQELQFHNNNHPNENYLAFTRNLLREVARMIGITYESLSLDYDGATYSSVLMGQATIHPMTVRRRKRLSVPFLQQIHRAWLDEMIFRGRVSFPGGYQAYLRNRRAASRATWRGPPKPRADELKSARAQSERLGNNSASISMESLENGQEVADLARQMARDIRTFEKHGLPNPYAKNHPPRELNSDGLQPDEVE